MTTKEIKQNDEINPSAEYQIRLKKLEKIKEQKINPYPSVSKRNFFIAEILENFEKFNKEKNIIIAGRIISLRWHGKSCFGNLLDSTEKIQFYLKEDELGKKNYNFFIDQIDVGDIVELKGTLFTTKKGEKTLMVNDYTLLSKSLLPLPAKWHGLSDIEIRFRKRYLDLIANPAVKEIFIKRSKIIKFIRNYLEKQGFLEVDTPILQPQAGGAAAKPFITHHNALDIDLFLRIAPELYLKRLIIGGFEKIFEIGRCFRNEGIDFSHNPEFTQVEFYWAYQDYYSLMEFTERFVKDLIQEINGSLTVEYKNYKLDFSKKIPRIDYHDLIKKELEIDLDKYLTRYEIAVIAEEKGLTVDKAWGRGKIIDEMFKKFIRPEIIDPIFLINYPLELSPLAKKIESRPNYIEKFQLIVNKMEIVNAFGELNDPLDQEERFKEQQKLKEAGDEETESLDNDYIEALKYGLPPTAGFGMGIDRLTALLTNTHNIKEVILFPTMKPEKT